MTVSSHNDYENSDNNVDNDGDIDGDNDGEDDIATQLHSNSHKNGINHVDIDVRNDDSQLNCMHIMDDMDNEIKENDVNTLMSRRINLSRIDNINNDHNINVDNDSDFLEKSGDYDSEHDVFEEDVYVDKDDSDDDGSQSMRMLVSP
jgi:hypothetical protein